MGKDKKKNEEIKEIEEKKNFSKIYIGPTIRKYNLQENSVYINKYPEYVEKAIEEFPVVKNLILDTKNLKDRNKENYKILYRDLKKEIGGK